jgi:hypothetical protein
MGTNMYRNAPKQTSDVGTNAAYVIGDRGAALGMVLDLGLNSMTFVASGLENAPTMRDAALVAIHLCLVEV